MRTASSTLPDLVRGAALANPRGIATVFEGERVPWAALADRVARAAAGLRALGVGYDDKVAILAANTPQNLEFTYAVLWLGAVPVPLNTRLAVPELAWICNNAEATTFAFDRRMRPVAERLLAEIAIDRRVDIEGDGGLEALRAETPIPPAPHELACINYTGGTTGLPKGVMLTQQAYATQSRNFADILGCASDSVYLHAVPLFHVAGICHLHATTAAAGTHAFLPVFSPEAVFAKIRDDGVNEIALVPTMLAALMDSSTRDDAALARIRSVAYGAAPITQTLLRRLLPAFPNARMQQFYGQTESTGPCLGLSPDRHVLDGANAGKLATAGRAVQSFQIGVVGADGRECRRGEAGEIRIAGPAVMKGYWRNPALTAETIRDGWLHTGDVGVMDDDGFVTVVDRLKDMIVSGGENVYSSEVESAIASHPAVAACAVVGIPDERWGEAVVAFVVPRAGAAVTPEEVAAHCRGKIAGYKIPKSVIVRDRPLPLSGVGKVQKNVLRAELRR